MPNRVRELVNSPKEANDVTPALPVSPGQPERVDYEYQRVGTANLFVMGEPLNGFRHIEVTQRRTIQDYTRQLQWLAEVAYLASR